MKKIVWGTVILSFILKLIWIIKVPLTPIYDFETLYNVAVNLHNGLGFTLNGYPWGFQSYGYPMILSWFFNLIGDGSIFAAKFFNVVCSTLTLPLIYLILKKYLSNKKIIIACFLLAAFLPNHIIYNNVLGTEILSTLLFAGILCFVLYGDKFDTRINYLIKGILCGVLSLIKPFFLAYPIALIFIYFVKDKRTILKSAIFLILGTSLIIIPSIIKNYKAFGEIIPVSYNGGYVLYINNNSENSKGGWMDASGVRATDELKEKLAEVGYEYDVPHDIEKTQILRNPKISKILQSAAIKWIVKNPFEFISLGFLRLVNVFFSGASDVSLWGFENLGQMTISQSKLFKIFMGISNTLIYVISFSYLVILFTNLKRIFSKKLGLNMLTLIWSVAFFYAVYFVFEGQARYNFPVLFLLIVCIGLVWEKYIGVIGEKTDNGKDNKKD